MLKKLFHKVYWWLIRPRYIWWCQGCDKCWRTRSKLLLPDVVYKWGGDFRHEIWVSDIHHGHDFGGYKPCSIHPFVKRGRIIYTKKWTEHQTDTKSAMS